MTSDASDLMALLALPGVAAAVEQARTAIEALRRHPANRRGAPTSAALALSRAARASAAVDGAPLALGDPHEAEIPAAVVDVGEPGDIPTRAHPMLAGALRVAAEIPGLVPVWRRAPLQALARLHVLAAADLVESDRLGRPRALDAPAAARLAGLAHLVARVPGRGLSGEPPGIAWLAPIMIAVVHGELLDLQPFGSADGVVARAAGRLEMMATGFDPAGLGVPEVAVLRAGPRYHEQRDRYRSGGVDGVGEWIVFVCRTLVAGAREGGSIADASARRRA